MRQLPSIYTALEEVNDPLEIFFFPSVSTANIPDKKATVLTLKTEKKNLVG